ncbi:MAG: PHP domain-containing protein [Candidatus Woesearchaeota archaeon]
MISLLRKNVSNMDISRISELNRILSQLLRWYDNKEIKSLRSPEVPSVDKINEQIERIILILHNSTRKEGLWDGHTHTYYSDGDYSPTQVVINAKAEGLSTIIVCDHDGTGGIEEAVMAGRKCGVSVIPGVEISTKSRDKKDLFFGIEVHILGIWPKESYENSRHKLKEMDKKLEKVREIRTFRTFKMLEKYRDNGINIDIGKKEDYKRGFAARAHLAKARFFQEYGKTPQQAIKEGETELVAKEIKRFESETGRGGIAEYTYGDAEKEYGCKAFFEPEEAVSLIHDLGGTAILAHPGEILEKYEKKHEKDYKLEWKELAAFIAGLVKDCKLDGLEVYTPKHSHEDMKMLQKIAKHHKLIMTLGSDYHGMELKPKVKLGRGINSNLTRYNFFQNLKQFRTKKYFPQMQERKVA